MAGRNSVKTNYYRSWQRRLISPFEILRRRQTQRTADVAEVLGDADVNVAHRPTALDLVRRSRESASKREHQSEAQRILALPSWDPDQFKVDLTPELKTPTGTMRLLPIQSLALHWAREANGLLGSLAVGTGKTIISLLVPVVMRAKRPLLLIPTDAQAPLQREYAKLRPHWKLPPIVSYADAMNRVSNGALRILPYSQLSTAKSTELLEVLRPDLVIADEVHCLRYTSSARAKRVIRLLTSYPETRFVGLSGTITSKGLRDYAHICELALRNNSPVPLLKDDLINWANLIDADAEARDQDIRGFMEFCPDLHGLTGIEVARARDEIARKTEEGRELKNTNGDTMTKSRKRVARRVFRDRFVRTVGVVATKEGSVQCSLKLRERPLAVPAVVGDALTELDETWTRPDGEELVQAIDKWRCAAQLSQGFYYRWDWPDGVKDEEWLGYRAAWHREVREVLKKSLAGLDSPLLVVRAVTGERLDQFSLEPHEIERLTAAWQGWSEVSEDHPELPPPNKRPKPPTETVWLDGFLLEDVLEWRKEHPKGLIWFDDRAIESMLRALGVETYGGGEDPPEDGRGMALSINAFKQVRNLQKNSENLILSWQTSGQVMEQCIGRSHRQGQEADEVLVDYYAHTDSAQEAVEKSRRDAEYLQQTQGSPQKLIYGTWIELRERH